MYLDVAVGGGGHTGVRRRYAFEGKLIFLKNKKKNRPTRFVNDIRETPCDIKKKKCLNHGNRSTTIKTG